MQLATQCCDPAAALQLLALNCVLVPYPPGGLLGQCQLFPLAQAGIMRRIQCISNMQLVTSSDDQENKLLNLFALDTW